jgi:mannose/cellobiose epimerase-like protein (N-acyl-D-glucosamine 2-epimerase family)
MERLISRQEKEKVDKKTKTLYEWMCFEAEGIIKYNWTDVAVHDRNILSKMRVNETRLWAIYELGSALLPLTCHVNEQVRQEILEYEMSSVEAFCLRFLKPTSLGERERDFRKDTKFYFITKTDSDYDYFAVPASTSDVMAFVFCGAVDFSGS